MNTPNNKRRRESLQKIETAFVDLLRVKALNQISVSDICKDAGLNRSTFYANYVDIYALADSIRDQLESNLSEMYQSEIAAGFSTHNYLKLFRHIKEHQMLYTTYFKLGYDDNFKIVWYDTELAKRHFQNRFVEYHIEFFKSGLTKILKMWLQNGCRESPEEIFEILQDEYRGRQEFFLSDKA